MYMNAKNKALLNVYPRIKRYREGKNEDSSDIGLNFQ